MKTQFINLNMTPSGINPTFHIAQYDVGRLLGFHVYNGSEVVDLDGYTCTIEATRTDGTQITANVITTNNQGVFAVTAEMSNEADKYACQLVVIDSNANRIASLPFIMDVITAALNGNAESISEDRTLYQQYNAAMQAALANEANDRINADNLEKATRQSAFNTLQNNINAEATARQTADNTLQGNILNAVQAEKNERIYADNSLSSRISQNDARINNLVGNTGNSNSEIVDARVGVDGSVYSNLGTAIRTQVNNINEDLGEFVTKEKSVNLLNPRNIITGYLYNIPHQEDGSYKVELSENSSFSCAYIDITEGNNYIATGISYNAYNADDEGNAIGIAYKSASGSTDTPTFNTSEKNSNFGDTSRTATRLYFSWRNETYPTETFMIVEGAELPSTYIPYYIKKYINNDVEIDYQQLKNKPIEEIKLYVGFGEGENHFNTVVDAFKETEKQEGYYIVYIAEGTYDMFEEYGGLATLQKFDSSVDTPYNTQPWLYNVHVIGCGRVKLTYNPQTDDYSDARWLYSPVNIRGEVTLENIEIYCNGGRYCIHDETGNIADYYDKEHVYKNVICETGANTGRCIGGGCDYGQRYLFENCSFKSGYSKNWSSSGIVSWHNRGTTRGCTFVFNNCKFTHTDDSKEHSDLRFSNVGTGNALSNVYLNNCYFSYRQIRLAIESETNPSDNQYQIICSNCNKQSLLVDESLGDNKYPLIEYNPIN